MISLPSLVFFKRKLLPESTITVRNYDICSSGDAVLLYGGMRAVSSFGWVQGSARFLAQAD